LRNQLAALEAQQKLDEELLARSYDARRKEIATIMMKQAASPPK